MKTILFSKKGFSLLAIGGVLDSFVFPHPIAFIAFTFFFLLDLLTGLALARKIKAIESKKARQKTFEKVIQYTVVITVGIGASTCANYLPPDIAAYSMPLKIIGDILLWYCVAIEVLSNIENGIKINPDSVISKSLLKPIGRRLKLKVDDFEKYLDTHLKQ